ncbi:unnamed protein product [Fusarium graminearum]|uniref:Uncharacterized protein n=1 Tax=Gibberella zeae TaxID=5518 RepID=A0A4E9DVL8_GIBZA|nr:unnamed protein product [Fusarium graminearum]CAG2008037.1 unnamed protein product [Fusarium graminearum]
MVVPPGPTPKLPEDSGKLEAGRSTGNGDIEKFINCEHNAIGLDAILKFVPTFQLIPSVGHKITVRLHVRFCGANGDQQSPDAAQRPALNARH